MARNLTGTTPAPTAALRRAVTGVLLTLACIGAAGCEDDYATETGPGGNGGGPYQYDDNGRPGSDWFENEYDGDNRWNPPPPQGPYSP